MDVELEQPHVHHRKTGHDWLDFALPVAALFVSFVSIYIAWHHGQVMKELVHQNEKLVEANSLPYVQISANDEKGAVTFNAINEGVGPAKIVTAEIRVDDRPVPNLSQLIAACCGRVGYDTISTSTLQGRMVRPGDTVSYISMPKTGTNALAALELNRARQSHRIVTRLCYCSVFEDCWVSESTDANPTPVDKCVPPELPYKGS